MNVISLAAERQRRRNADRIADEIERLAAWTKHDLLHGPVTPEVIEALETLSDDAVERFFRARARAKLDAARNLADPS